jgi:hypothetical protein
MKLVKILCAGALLALSATAATAGSVDHDPKLVVNGTGPGGTPEPGARPLIVDTFGKTTQMDPLMINFSVLGSAAVDYEYVGPPNTITKMWIEIVDIPSADLSETFGCLSNVFKSTGVQVPPSSGNYLCGTAVPAQGDAVEFALYNGLLKSGNEISISLSNQNISSTPEPSTLLMFLGLGPVVGFAKKRWGAKLSA